MGEAKRRKAAGQYPAGQYPAGPVTEFRVARGQVGLSIDVEGSAYPVTLTVEAGQLIDILGRFDRMPRTRYHSLVRGLAREFVAGLASGDDVRGISLAMLWTALNHPDHGAAMRSAVSRSLRETGKAHLTWRYASDTGFAVALADGFVELDEPLRAAAAIPEPLSLVISRCQADEPLAN